MIWSADLRSTDDFSEIKLYSKSKIRIEGTTEQKKKSLMPCNDVLKRFEKQDIFKSVIYRDGTIKMPTGQVIKPQRPIKSSKKKVKKKK